MVVSESLVSERISRCRGGHDSGGEDDGRTKILLKGKIKPGAIECGRPRRSRVLAVAAVVVKRPEV